MPKRFNIANNIGLAVIGCGRIGLVHAANIATMPEVRLTYVYDQIPQLAKKVSRIHNVNIANNIQEIMEDGDTHGLLICTPPGSHVSLIKAGVMADKAIFCEKPLAHSLKEGIECSNFIDEHKGLLMVGFNRRFDLGNYAIKQRTTKGEIGQIEHIQIISRDPKPPPLSYISKSGGLFIDMTIHDFDMALNLLPESPNAISVMASAIADKSIAKAGDCDSALISMGTAQGISCVIHNSRRAVYGYDQRVEVFGSKGMLQTQNLYADNIITATKKGYNQSPLQYFFLERYNLSYKAIITTFIRALKGNKNACMEANETVNSGVNSIYLAQQAAKAYKKQTTINLSLPV